MLDTGFFSGVAGRTIGWAAYLLSPVIRFLPGIGSFMRSGASSGIDLADLAVRYGGVPSYPLIPHAYTPHADKHI